MENISPPLLLLVDDEPGITITLSELLRRDGYRVDATNTGAEAIDLISRIDKQANDSSRHRRYNLLAPLGLKSRTFTTTPSLYSIPTGSRN